MSLVKIKINDVEYEVPAGINVLRACEDYAKVQIPRFCYHEKLKIAGNCRMCLVEIKPGPPKPAASCAMPVANGMEILTESEMIVKARNGVAEFLLANHPLDCPVCDQAGECDLQDQVYIYGKDKSGFCEAKRVVHDKYFGPLINAKMTRCIHCTRCVRFITEVAGFPEIGAINRGENTEITTLEKAISSELSGNLIDLCPVGALTSKPYAGRARSWELSKTDSIDVFDSLCSNIRIDSKNNEVLRVLPRKNDDINEEWISDKTRFAIDGLTNQRIDSFMWKSGKNFEKVTQETIVKKSVEILRKATKIGAIIGKMTDLETVYVIKKLLNQIGENNKISASENDLNIDTISTGNYTFNAGISGIDEADFILIIGCNIRKDSPVLNARIRRNVITKNIPVFIIDEDRDLKYPATLLENNTETLTKILNGRSEISTLLSNANKPMMIIGEDVISGDNGLNLHKLIIEIANRRKFVTENWNGYCFLHKNSSTMNSLMLNVHNTRSSEIISDAKSGEIDVLLLINCEKIPDVSSNCKIISINSHGFDNINLSKIIIPALIYVEKTAIYINTEGRPQATTKAVEIVNPEFDEVETICKIIKKFDANFTANSRKGVVSQIAIEFPNIANNFNKIISEKPAYTGDIDLKMKAIVKSEDYNFYMTDLISKNSVNMAKCVQEILLGKENDN